MIAHKLFRKLSLFFDGLLSKRKKPITREGLKSLLIKHNDNTTACAKELNCSRDKIIWWATKHMLHISRNSFELNHNVFSKPTIQSSYWAGVLSGDGSIKRHLKYDYLLELTNTDKELVTGFAKFIDSKKIPQERIPLRGKKKYSLTISSQFIIDDLKLWNLEPKKSKHNKIPDCIKDNDLLCHWIVGLIDSDGSVYLKKKDKNIGITILASKEICLFLNKWLNIPCCFCQEKKIENLYNLKFSGKNAVALYNKIYRDIGLVRKWSIIEPFLNKQWHH